MHLLTMLNMLKPQLQGIKVRPKIMPDDSYIKIKVYNDEQEFNTALIDDVDVTLFDFIQNLLETKND